MRLAAIAVLVMALTAASERSAAAEDVLLGPLNSVPDAETCSKGLLRATGLVRNGHNVDAHLLAQTMSVLCAESPSWDIVDAVALAHLDEHTRAYALLDSVALEPGPEARRARVLAAWVLVKGNLGDPTIEGEDGARVAIFTRIHRGRSPGPRMSELPLGLSGEVAAGYKRLAGADSKSPWLAGSLSAVLPGAGQVYAGSWQGAAVSLVLNGIFISATVELLQNDLYLASATTGMAASIFYVGNILNAVDLVKRYNQGRAAKHRLRLESLLIPESRL